MEDALREEGIENREVIRHDIAWADRAIAGADSDILALQAPASPKATPVALHPIPRDIFAPGNNAWLTMRDSGLLGIAPRELVENYWKVYYTQEVSIMEIRAVGADGDRVLALVSLHNSPAGLPSTERDALLVAYANYRQSLKHLRGALTALDKVTAVALADQRVGMDN